MKRVQLEKIINDAGTPASREIIVIKGYAFYKSTGNNSAMGGLWLPFGGITAEEEKTFGLGGYKIGDYIKPDTAYMIKEKFLQEEVIRDYFGEDMFSLMFPRGLLTTEKLGRFGNLECMLISLALGPKEWDQDPELTPVKEFLQKNYSEALNFISMNYIINPKAKSDAIFKSSKTTADSTKTATQINKKLSAFGKEVNAEDFPKYDTQIQRIENYKINTDEKTTSLPKVMEEKASPSIAADVKKTEEILEPLLPPENKFQKITVSADKLTAGLDEKYEYKTSKTSLHINFPIPEPESKNDPAAGILEELSVLSINNHTVKISEAIFQKIDYSDVDSEGKPAPRITVELTDDINRNPAKAEKLLNFIYGITLPHQSSNPSIKIDGLTLDKTPLFKQWSSPKHVRAIAVIEKSLQSYLELLYDRSDTIKATFNRDGNRRTDKPENHRMPKGQELQDLSLDEHKFTRSLLKILREDRLPKSKLAQFVKFFEANKDFYFKFSSPSRFPALFKPTNVRKEIENYLSKNSLLPKAEVPAPEFH